MIFTFKFIKSSLYSYRCITNRIAPGVVAIVLLKASMAHATPLVNGQEISWPDDGWYQVQSADGQTSICTGMRTCVVEPGRYIVINHTTGERFENIVVGGDNSSGHPDGVMVEGNTISWPDDGWYQVQSASTYESLCEGGSSCEVDAGAYVVINHTTSKRVTKIVVGGGDDTVPVERPAEAMPPLDTTAEAVAPVDTNEEFKVVELTSHSDGDVLASGVITFELDLKDTNFDDVAYRVGSTPSSSTQEYGSVLTYLNSWTGGIPNSITATNLPQDGSDVYLTMQFKLDGIWNPDYNIIAVFQAYTEIAAPAESAQPFIVEPVAAQPEIAPPEAALPEIAQPETEQPETEQPETEQPETEQPETEQPEAEVPEAEVPDEAVALVETAEDFQVAQLSSHNDGDVLESGDVTFELDLKGVNYDDVAYRVGSTSSSNTDEYGSVKTYLDSWTGGYSQFNHSDQSSTRW